MDHFKAWVKISEDDWTLIRCPAPYFLTLSGLLHLCLPYSYPSVSSSCMMRTNSLSVLFAIGLQGLKLYLELCVCVCVPVCVCMRFPGGSVITNPPANAGDSGSIPGLGRTPGEGNGNPLQYSCLGNPQDRGARQATVYGVTKEMDMTYQQLW